MEPKRRELTLLAIVLGAGLAVVMGAANVYLGLKAGMTVSASIPAAVVAMGILASLRRRNVLEANMVQTGASAGESLAAGVIFTLPALVMIGYWQQFDFWTTAAVSLAGGLLGILFMIPMRKVFIANSPELPYPEGVACAEVLRAGARARHDEDEVEASTGGLALILGALLVGGFFKIATKSLGLIKENVAWAAERGGHVYMFGMSISPALIAVGLIVGLPIASQVFAGGVIGYFVALPLIPISTLPELPDRTVGMADEIAIADMLWATQVRYIGVGAMLVGGFASIWRVRSGLSIAVRESWRQIRRPVALQEEVAETERDISGKVILVASVVCVALTFGIYVYMTHGAWAISAVTTVMMLLMAFFFTAVASYIVGLVGNSSSPVSGMTITALLGTAVLIAVLGFEGMSAMVATLGVASVVCCAACTSGDVCNDLKTGYLVGASPRNQQIMQIIGVAVACLVMAPVLNALHIGSLNEAEHDYQRRMAIYDRERAAGKEVAPPIAIKGGIGGDEMSAPQATLMKSLVQGVFGNGTLPWGMIVLGVAIGGVILVADFFLRFVGFPVPLYLMPIAVGIYLPLRLSVSIFVGGLLHFFIMRLAAAPDHRRHATKRAVLIASGLIAGESLLGVAGGILAYYGVHGLDLTADAPAAMTQLVALAASQWTALAATGLLCGGVAYWALRRARVK